MEHHGKYLSEDIEVKIPDWLVAKWAQDVALCCKRGTEDGHVYADDILCTILTTLGLRDVVEEFSKLDKWYS